ncbi:MAG: 50S ribosomal protein L34e [Candidatus Micrarchaeota archaeon]|nr:50S ribosomal protein L34e [Candidatus Micrarchaeota archaeon]
MPKPKNRSRSMRKLYRKLPSGKTVTRFKRKNSENMQRDAITKEPLQGTSNSRKLSKSEKSVTRKYGGYLSHRNVQKIMEYATLIEQGELSLKDVPLSMRKYVKNEVERLIKKKQ